MKVSELLDAIKDVNPDGLVCFECSLTGEDITAESVRIISDTGECEDQTLINGEWVSGATVVTLEG